MIAKRPKLLFSIFVLVLMLSLLATACQPSVAEDVTPENTPVSEETDNEATPAEEPAPVSEPSQGETVSADIILDPALATDKDSLLITSYLYETLIDVDGNSVLATDWTISDDQLDYIFNLESGISFHDGTLFNADAVIANFNRWYSGEADYAAWKDTFGGYKAEVDDDGTPLSIFDGIEKVDALTVLIHLNEPAPNLLANLSDPAFAMRSPTSTDNASTAGTGPYYISSWTTLLDLGLTKKEIKALGKEEARVRKIIELQKKNKK